MRSITGNRFHRNIDTALGVFGQYRHTINPRTAIGLQLGYSQDSNTYPDARPANTLIFSNITLSSDSAYEILGFVSRHGKTVNPFVMFGFRSLEIESSIVGQQNQRAKYAFASEDDLTGWKVAAGVEVPLRNNWFGQIAVQYTDYGNEQISTTPTVVATDPGISLPSEREFDFDLQQTGLRFALGYSF